MPEERERLALKDETQTSVEEARMVLPGIQALFGFQLIAVFNQRFTELSSAMQLVHLASIGFVTLAIAFVMAPAAYDRIAERGWVSRHFINLTSRLLSCAMGMLMVGLALEVALVVNMVIQSSLLSGLVGALVVVLMGSLWFVMPLRHRSHHQPPLPVPRRSGQKAMRSHEKAG